MIKNDGMLKAPCDFSDSVRTGRACFLPVTHAFRLCYN